MSSGNTTEPKGRDEKGRFGPGNPGGPGRRPRSSPLHRAISDEKAAELWAARVVVAEGEPERYTDQFGVARENWSRVDAAAEFILKYKNGTPAQSAPALPEIDWPRITCVADLAGTVNAVLGAQASGDLDSAGLVFLVDLIAKLAKIFETVELAPQIHALQEQVAELRATAIEPARK